MARINWRNLDISDGERSLGTLGEVLDNASDSQIKHIRLSPSGEVESWADRYLSTPDEAPGWDTPRGEVDWTGFRDVLAEAITRL